MKSRPSPAWSAAPPTSPGRRCSILAANWCAPLNNTPLDAEEMARIKASYDEIFARLRETPGGFIHGPDRRKALEAENTVGRDYLSR